MPGNLHQYYCSAKQHIANGDPQIGVMLLQLPVRMLKLRSPMSELLSTQIIEVEFSIYILKYEWGKPDTKSFALKTLDYLIDDEKELN